MKTLLTTLAAFGSCQGVKRYLDRETRAPRAFAGGHVKLTALRNENGAFGMKLRREVLLTLGAAALAAVWTQRRCAPGAAGLILGGGISNLAERLRCGKVYDYVQFPKAPGRLKKYVFNLADFAILAGGVLLVLGKRR